MNELQKYQLTQRFNQLLKATGRPNMDKLLSWMESSTDFYTSPASSKYHLSTECGLLQHSLNVYDAMMSTLEKVPEAEKPDQACNESYYRFKIGSVTIGSWKESSIVIAALLHDLCKVNTYIQEVKNKKVYSETGAKKDSMGRYDWQSVPGFSYRQDVDMPYGHGELSVMLLSSFIPTTMEEKFAIRWHMGAYGLRDGKDEGMLSQAFKKYPLAFVLAQADQMATNYMEEEEHNKEGFEKE